MNRKQKKELRQRQSTRRHTDDAHELPGRLPLAQLLFLFPIHGSSLHS